MSAYKLIYKIKFFIIVAVILTLFCGCTSADSFTGADTAARTETAGTESEAAVMGIKQFSDIEITDLTDGRKLVSAAELGAVIYYDGAAIPVTGDLENYYLTVDENISGWGEGRLTASGGCILAVAKTDTQSNLTDLMKAGTPLSLYVYTDSLYAKVNMIFTSLPVITVNTKGNSIGDTDVKCEFSVFALRTGKSAASLTSSKAAIRVRGATSSTMPKTGFKLNLFNDDYSDKNKISLLGMRCDDDWILYPSYSDESKIRDAVAWELWSKIGSYSAGEAEGTVALRYTEMILNGEYYGFYVLMERFDQKTLGLDSGDALFIATSWDIPQSSLLRRQSYKSNICDGVEKKYPDPAEADDQSWKTFADFMEITYESDGSVFADKINDCANADNMLDYWLFLQVIMGEDNSWKNTYYALKDGKFYAYPWDLDITQGLTWKEDAKNFLVESAQVTSSIYDFQCGRRLIKYCPGAADYIKRRWKELSDAGVVTYEGIMAVARSYWDTLQNSGAFRRNIKRWPDTSYVDNLTYYDKIIKQRIEFLDNYINSLTDAGQQFLIRTLLGT